MAQKENVVLKKDYFWWAEPNRSKVLFKNVLSLESSTAELPVSVQKVRAENSSARGKACC